MFHVRLSGTLGARLLRNTSLQRLPRGRPTLHAVPDAEMPVLPVMSPPACQSIAPMALQSATSAMGPTPLPSAHRWCASSATSLAMPPGLAISRPSAPDVVGQDTTAAKAWLTTGPALNAVSKVMSSGCAPPSDQSLRRKHHRRQCQLAPSSSCSTMLGASANVFSAFIGCRVRTWSGMPES